MKSDEKVEKNPIKDKYTQKVGFFKKIQLKLIKLKNSIKNNKSLMEDVASLGSIVGTVLMYGILGSFAATLIGLNISFMGILGIGSLSWLIEKKIIEFVTRILGSIKLVEVNN